MKNIEELKNKVIQGDCIEIMKEIPDKSIDMVLAVINPQQNGESKK